MTARDAKGRFVKADGTWSAAQATNFRKEADEALAVFERNRAQLTRAIEATKAPPPRMDELEPSTISADSFDPGFMVATAICAFVALALVAAATFYIATH